MKLLRLHHLKCLEHSRQLTHESVGFELQVLIGLCLKASEFKIVSEDKVKSYEGRA